MNKGITFYLLLSLLTPSFIFYDEEHKKYPHTHNESHIYIEIPKAEVVISSTTVNPKILFGDWSVAM